MDAMGGNNGWMDERTILLHKGTGTPNVILRATEGQLAQPEAAVFFFFFNI